MELRKDSTTELERLSRSSGLTFRPRESSNDLDTVGRNHCESKEVSTLEGTTLRRGVGKAPLSHHELHSREAPLTGLCLQCGFDNAEYKHQPRRLMNKKENHDRNGRANGSICIYVYVVVDLKLLQR